MNLSYAFLKYGFDSQTLRHNQWPIHRFPNYNSESPPPSADAPLPVHPNQSDKDSRTSRYILCAQNSHLIYTVPLSTGFHVPVVSKHPANMFSCFFVSVLILDSFWWFVNDFHPSRIIFSVFHVFIYFFCLYSQQYVMLFSKKIFSKQLRYTAPCFIISSM